MDIGILVLNSKFNMMAPFKDLVNDNELETIMNVNLMHPILMTKSVLSKI
jgi:short-subunit dehydrogenase